MRDAESAKAVAAFRAKFGKEPENVAFAPGRVNIIGEHTDYQEGFVLPCAVDLATYVVYRPRDDMRVRLYSDMAGEDVEYPIDPTAKASLPFWAHYAWGTAMSLLERGLPVRGFDGYSASTVPQGGGLSSSASFEIAMALAYLGENAAKVSKIDLAHLCRRAENAFVGVNCGIMDQFSSIHGTDGHAIMLDCRSLEYRLVPVPENVTLVVSDTRVRHALGETGYHTRQQECKDAVAVLAKAGEKVKMLRDATPEMLERHKKAMKDAVYRRARHVISENARVLETADVLGAGDVRRLGKLVSESHVSLRDDFEVSCKELDAMVEAAEGLSGHYGTRMVGGGFGGCTVSVVEESAVHGFTHELAERYKKATGIEAITRVVVPGRGAGLLGLPQES